MNSNSLPLIVEASTLEPLLPTAELLLIAVCQAKVFKQQHIPGSVLIEPSELVCGIKPATGKLPDVEQLSAVFSRAGLSHDTHVIAYDDEGGGWAGRLIWTLDVIGHRHCSYLNGGLIAWIKAGYSLTTGSSQGQPSAYQASIERTVIADMDEVLSQIENPRSVIWDARSIEEFNGSKITARRNGHIPGAINLDWLELVNPDDDWRLQPLPTLANKLEALGITSDKQIITHCLTHHRSGLAYLVGKALGLNIKAYDGSWSEWGNHAETPIEN